MYLFLSFWLFVMWAVPAAVKVLAIAGVVYAVLQAAKQSPWLSPYLQGWLAVLVNVLLTVLGVVVTIPADQLYTLTTLETVLVTVLASAGIHGTVSKVIMPAKG
jgi:hypothetical protein